MRNLLAGRDVLRALRAEIAASALLPRRVRTSGDTSGSRRGVRLRADRHVARLRRRALAGRRQRAMARSGRRRSAHAPSAAGRLRVRQLAPARGVRGRRAVETHRVRARARAPSRARRCCSTARIITRASVDSGTRCARSPTRLCRRGSRARRSRRRAPRSSRRRGIATFPPWRESFATRTGTRGRYRARSPHARRRSDATRSSSALLVRDVEPWLAMLPDGGNARSRALLRAAWRTLLEGHPHDTLCGTSIDAVALALDARHMDVGEQLAELRDEHARLADRARRGGCAARTAAVEAGRRRAQSVRSPAWRRRGACAQRNDRRRRRRTRLRDPTGPSARDPGVARGGRAASGVDAKRARGADGIAPRLSRRGPRRGSSRARLGAARSPATRRNRSRSQSAGPRSRTPKSPTLYVYAGRRSRTGCSRVSVGEDAVHPPDGARVRSQRRAAADVRGRRATWAISTRQRSAEPRPALAAGRVRVVHQGPLRGELSIDYRTRARGGPRVSVRVFLSLDADGQFVRIVIEGENDARDHRLRLRIATGLSDALHAGRCRVPSRSARAARHLGRRRARWSTWFRPRRCIDGYRGTRPNRARRSSPTGWRSTRARMTDRSP